MSACNEGASGETRTESKLIIAMLLILSLAPRLSWASRDQAHDLRFTIFYVRVLRVVLVECPSAGSPSRESQSHVASALASRLILELPR